MSGSLIDANVLLDIATADATWMAWSQDQVLAAAERGPVYINAIIYAELAAGFATQQDLDRWMDPAVFQRTPLPYDAGWLAAQAFVSYRRAGGVRNSPLPDFYIGAHAQVEQLTLVSRDPARYRTYFPSVALIAP
jgi:predicted nucleic acid-binding protein